MDHAVVLGTAVSQYAETRHDTQYMVVPVPGTLYAVAAARCTHLHRRHQDTTTDTDVALRCAQSPRRDDYATRQRVAAANSTTSRTDAADALVCARPHCCHKHASYNNDDNTISAPVDTQSRHEVVTDTAAQQCAEQHSTDTDATSLCARSHRNDGLAPWQSANVAMETKPCTDNQNNKICFFVHYYTKRKGTTGVKQDSVTKEQDRSNRGLGRGDTTVIIKLCP